METGVSDQKPCDWDLGSIGVCWDVESSAAMFVYRQGCWDTESNGGVYVDVINPVIINKLVINRSVFLL